MITQGFDRMRQITLSLLILTTIFTGALPATANDGHSRPQLGSPTANNLIAQATQVDLIGVGASIINSLINPPSRAAEINADAEVKKAKIAADAEIVKEKLRIEASKSTDRVTPVLDKWGVTRVACAPGLVFVNGITTDTVCIQPDKNMSAGYYTYDSAKQQLVKNSGDNVQNNQNTQTLQNTQTIQNNQNIQTIQTNQTTRITSPRNPQNRVDREQGF
jgi:hypothetical protein